jgi:hypothetical protein
MGFRGGLLKFGNVKLDQFTRGLRYEIDDAEEAGDFANDRNSYSWLYFGDFLKKYHPKAYDYYHKLTFSLSKDTDEFKGYLTPEEMVKFLEGLETINYEDLKDFFSKCDNDPSYCYTEAFQYCGWDSEGENGLERLKNTLKQVIEEKKFLCLYMSR